MKTGAELKARREELKITQQDLADKIGVSRTQLSRMENGKIEINNYIRTKIEAILTNSEEYKESELTINDINKPMKKEDYLKMNEKEDVSFDDLIDAAVQAKKDGVINHLIIGSSMIDFNYDYDDKNNHFDEEEVKEGIEFIQSLYTEEFVIETMADELKIKSGAEVTLSNGMKCVYFDDGEKKLRYDDDFYPCNFLILKGATVKQSKGAK